MKKIFNALKKSKACVKRLRFTPPPPTGGITTQFIYVLPQKLKEKEGLSKVIIFTFMSKEKSKISLCQN